MTDSFVTPGTAACQAPLSMGFSGQEYWSWLPFPSPGDLPNSGIKFVSLALAGGFFIIESPGKPTHQGCWPVTFFSCGVLFWFLRLDNAGLIKWLVSVPSCSIFWKSLTRIGINSSLLFDGIHHKAAWFWTSVYWEDFDYWVNLHASSLFIQISYFLIQSWKALCF